jgi:pyruvate dehydrogenase complex dehydrogenase (E1) component
LKAVTNAKVWAFPGREKRTNRNAGRVTLASREKLDNLIFKQLQPAAAGRTARGNGQIIQELSRRSAGRGETSLKLCGAAVIRFWSDTEGPLVKRMGDGGREYQKLVVSRRRIRAVFRRRPAGAEAGVPPDRRCGVALGGHDPRVYAAQGGDGFKGGLTVIWKRTIKG